MPPGSTRWRRPIRFRLDNGTAHLHRNRAPGSESSRSARTPLIRLDPGSRRRPEIFLKLEVFQPIGSFKIRGAMNAIAQLTPAELADGVWTVSAGNAAQGRGAGRA